MSKRTVSITTHRIQRAYGDTFYRAEVDFHLMRSEFGGRPAEQVAIDTVKLLWPTVQNVELSARAAADAQTRDDRFTGTHADRWIVQGTVGYSG